MNRKDEIMEACIQLICKKGLDLSSMQNIANEVGITKSTLYFYFDSKESLLREVFQHCHRLDARACNEGIDQIEHPIDKLIRRFENIIQYAITHPNEAMVERIFMVSPMYAKDAALAKYDFMQDIIRILQEGVAKKEIKEMPEWILAECFYGFAYSMYIKFTEESDLWENEEIRESCFQIIKTIMKKEKEEENTTKG